MQPSERYRGCLLGLAAGDALGTTLEFKWRSQIAQHKLIEEVAEQLLALSGTCKDRISSSFY